MIVRGLFCAAARRGAVLRSFDPARITQQHIARLQNLNSCYYSTAHSQISNQHGAKPVVSSEDLIGSQPFSQNSEQDTGILQNGYKGENVCRRDKIDFLVKTILDLNDCKEVVYGALDAWVAWEQNFPIGSLKRALLVLEKEQQWHRVIQVIKWMLSKGQGTTLRTYGQLIIALDMDHRAEEAHKFWVMKIGSDLHSVPWQICRSMIAIYFRNNMLQNLVKLFKELEAFGRKPPEKSIVQRVADSYEMLGLVEEKEKVLEKYKALFTDEGIKPRLKKHKRKTSSSQQVLEARREEDDDKFQKKQVHFSTPP